MSEATWASHLAVAWYYVTDGGRSERLQRAFAGEPHDSWLLLVDPEEMARMALADFLFSDLILGDCHQEVFLDKLRVELVRELDLGLL